MRRATRLKTLRLIVLILLSCFTAVSLQLPFDIAALIADVSPTLAQDPVSAYLIGLQSVVIASFPISLLIAIFSFIVYYMFLRSKATKKVSPRFFLLSLLFTCFMIIGKIPELPEISIGPDLIVMLILFSIAFLCLCYSSMLVLEAKIKEHLLKTSISATLSSTLLAPSQNSKTSKKRSSLIFSRRPLLMSFLLILLAWTPYIILCFPGTTDPYDVLDQLTQFHGIAFRTPEWINLIDPNVLLNNNHPVLHTILLNFFVDSGGALGSQNFGFFAFVLAQIFLLIFALAKTISFMRTISAPMLVRKIVLIVYCFVPIFPLWAICATKDIPFAALIILYTLMLARLVYNPAAFKQKSVGRKVGFVISSFILAIFVALMRNNGVYVILLSAPFLFFVRGATPKISAGVGLASVVCYFAITSAVFPILGISGGAVKEMLSVPFQQTARYVTYYPEEVSPDERHAIEQILPYEQLGSLYNPAKADNVKDTFIKTSSSKDLENYFAAWFSMGLKHPQTYVNATLMNCRSYFYPGANTSWVWTQLNRAGKYDEESFESLYEQYGFNLWQISAFENVRDWLRESFLLFMRTPIGIFFNMGFCAWLAMFAVCVLKKNKVRRAFIVFLPVLILLLVCIASPLDGSVRYALPLIFSLPFLLTFALCALSRKISAIVSIGATSKPAPSASEVARANFNASFINSMNPTNVTSATAAFEILETEMEEPE